MSEFLFRAAYATETHPETDRDRLDKLLIDSIANCLRTIGNPRQAAAMILLNEKAYKA